jgi:hypothetical protein
VGKCVGVASKVSGEPKQGADSWRGEERRAFAAPVAGQCRIWRMQAGLDAGRRLRDKTLASRFVMQYDMAKRQNAIECLILYWKDPAARHSLPA